MLNLIFGWLYHDVNQTLLSVGVISGLGGHLFLMLKVEQHLSPSEMANIFLLQPYLAMMAYYLLMPNGQQSIEVTLSLVGGLFITLGLYLVQK